MTTEPAATDPGDPFEVDGLRVLITGASSGLGHHFATMLARRGAKVALAARRADRLESLATTLSETGAEARSFAMDVMDTASVDAAVASAREAFGGLDLLVNNAGIAQPAAALDTDDELWSRTIGTNLDGAFRVARAFARGLRDTESPGAIVNIASVAGLHPAGHLAPYSASKAALIQLTRNLASEWARYHIRVNAIAPGYILTDINRHFFESEPGKAMIRRIPLRRIGKPQDLDGPLLLLASRAGAWMTGSVLVVDGGHLQAML